MATPLTIRLKPVVRFREFPFGTAQDPSMREAMSPRPWQGQEHVLVRGTGVEHRVVLAGGGDKCTCPWYSRHRGQRGPCKHILAARLLVEPQDG